MKNFKFHWGHVVILILVCFMTFIVTLLATAGDTGSLVTENYYEAELQLEDKISAQKRVNKLSQLPKWKSQANGLLIEFPKEVANKTPILISLLNSADKEKDSQHTVKNFNGKVIFPAIKLSPGEYEMEVAWVDSVEYLWKTTVLWEKP